MRNLVLLSERRKAIAVPVDSFPTIADGCDHAASICSMARDPGADDGGLEDHHHHIPQNAANSPPSAFYLTIGGTLIATSSAAPYCVCWTCNLNEVASVPGDPTAPASSPGWFDVTYVDDLDALVCLSRRGAIVTVEKNSGVADLVGEFDNGIEAGCWSPDKEVLVLYTHTDADLERAEGQQGDIEKLPALMTMNAQFEVLAEVVPESNVLPSASSVADEASVSICWRPDGTAIAISTVDVSDKTRRIRTYGRDDLALVSIGRSEDGSGKSVPNLLAPAGIAWSGLGCSQLITAVQQKGKRADSPPLVVFFEPNGLRHKEFKLRSDAGWEETVVNLCWSCQSDLLAVTLHCAKTNQDDKNKDVNNTDSTIRSKVQLWHRSNYHWYCKYELRYDRALVSMVNFDEERPHDIAVSMITEFSSDILVRDYAFAWDAGAVSPDGTAASIDGSLLNFTPFKQAIVPPPMYFATITMDDPVIGISSVPLCAGRTAGISWVAQLADGSICLLGDRKELEDVLSGNTPPANVGATRFVSPVMLAKIALGNAKDMRQLLVLSTSNSENGDIVVRCIAIACAEGIEWIVEIDITVNGTSSSANVVAKLPTEGRILRMVNWSDPHKQSGALIELNNGSLFEYEPSLETSAPGRIVPSLAESMLEPCPWIAGLHSAESVSDPLGDRRVIVGMSRRSRLYFGERILSDACSSFVLSPTHQFLSYATLGSRSQLRFIPLSVLAEYDPLMGSEDNVLALGDGYEPRYVERGSHVIAILPDAPTTVLQLPRGNLESIYPRALVLPFAMHLVDQGRYGEAMEIMRKQKIDLNLFCDMDPDHFLDRGIASFVTQVARIDNLNLFISCLFDGDITKWKYRVPPWFHRSHESITEGPQEKKGSFDFSTKVNQICMKMRDVMVQFESDGKTSAGTEVADDHYLLPILSTFAKQSPPKLEDALSMIRQNALSKRSGRSKKSPLLGDSAQSSIQYLAFLADYPLLFDTALGMYDFDLAHAVARNSQMDPKVYLPLLQRLRSLPESMAKYEVDVRLERFESALTNLIRSGEGAPDTTEAQIDASMDLASKDEDHIARCLSFIEKHKLHRLGLELYESNVLCKNKVMVSLGERLLTEGDSQAAVSIFSSVEPPYIDGARKAAQMCGDWQSFFFFLDLGTANDSKESRRSQRLYFAEEIADEIAAGKNSALSKREGYECAARILLDYAENVLGAVDMLIKAEMWGEGRRVARLYKRFDLVKKSIDAAALYGQRCIDDFDKRAMEFIDTNKRYQKCVVMHKDARRKAAAEGALDAVPDDTGSTFSMTSNLSNTSLRSNMSGSSVGSVTSVSSVITAGGMSTFSIISEEDVMKHKSKYNTLGGGGKKKKKKKAPKRSRNRILPGSEKELKELVGLLKFNCISEEYSKVIAETIAFLSQVGKQSLARALYVSYNDLLDKVDQSQKERKETTEKEIEEARNEARREGRDYDAVTIECEAEIDALSCKQLPKSIHQVFSFL